MSDLHPSVYTPALSRVETRVSSYDRLNAFLLAALLLVGTFATMLFMLWFTANFRPVEVIPDIVFEIGDPGEDKPEGVADDVLEPGVEEFPEVETPQLADSLLAVTSAVSTIQARNEHRDGNAPAMGRGRGLGSLDGGGDGGNGKPGWEIDLEARDKGTYAKQLSFFNIDIGAINKVNNQVYRLSDPAGAARVTQSTKGDEKKNKTVLFGHKNRRLQDWDKDLMKKATGINPEDFVLGQIFPQDLINKIRGQEVAYTEKAGRDVAEIRVTSFKIVEDGSGYKFEITGQTYKR